MGGRLRRPMPHRNPSRRGLDTRLRAGVEDLIDPVSIARAITDDDGAVVDFVVVHANRAAREWGSRAGSPWFPHGESGSPSALFERYVEVLAGGPTLTMQSYRVPSAGRAARLVDLSVSRVGEGLLLSWRDVTDRIESEQAIAAGEKRLRTALDRLLDPSAIARAERDADGRLADLRMDYVNDAGRAAIGDRRWVRAMLVECGAPELFEGLRRTLETGEPLVEHGVRLHVEGAERLIDCRAHRLDSEEVFVTWRNVTARVATARSLAASEERFRTTLENLPDGVAMASPVRDAAGRITDFVLTYANAAARAWGTPASGSLRARVAETAHPGLYEEYLTAFETGRPLGIDALPTRDGVRGSRYLDVRGLRVGDELLLTWRNVTYGVLATRALARSENRFREALDGLPDPVIIAAAVPGEHGEIRDFRLTFRNEQARQVLPRTASLRQLVVAAGVPGLFDRYVQAYVGGTPFIADEVALPENGPLPAAHMDIRAHRLGGDELLTTWRDVTGRVSAARQLAEQQERLRLAFDEAPIGVALSSVAPDDLGTILLANEAFAELTGYSRAQLIGMRFHQFSHPDEVEVDTAQIRELLSGTRERYQREKRILRADGGQLWVRRTVALVTTGGISRYLLTHLEDITQRRYAERELAHQALYDPLTGLANRHLLLDHLRTSLQALSRRSGALAVLHLDLDRFKDVNDSLGHDAGDDVLREVARRVQAALRGPDVAARLAGDEFAVVASVDDGLGAARLAERLAHALAGPIQLPGRAVEVRASIGVTTTSDQVAPNRPVDPETLLRQADLAMYQAKRHGVGLWAMYDERLHHAAMQRLGVEEMLREALRYGWLRLLYQPIVDLGSGQVASAEALLRIAHPRQGLLTPAAFIDVAEECNLIVPIGGWVLGEACAQLARWQSARRDMRISVNVSARQVRHLALHDQVAQALAASGVAPMDLLLEMTERVLMDATDPVVGDLRRTTELGCRLGIDDFGTGYSSLTYLKRFPVSTVKIDKSFVGGLGRRDDDTAIVEAVIGLARTLRLTAVAEGVETEEQLERLRGFGCHRAQGYLLGRPMPGADVERLLRSAPATTE